MAKAKKLEELHLEFLKQQEFVAKRSSQTIRGYEAAFKLLLKIIPAMTLKDLTSEIMQKFFSTLQKRERVVGKNKTKSGVKASTVGSYRSKLNSFFKWLIVRGVLKQNPFEGIGYPDINFGDRQYLSKRDVEKIISAVISQSTQNLLKKKRDLAMLYLLLFTGIRKGELLGLRLRDVDLERQELLIHWETSKSRKDRVVPIKKELASVLKDYIDCRNRFSPIQYAIPNLLVSINKDARLTEHGLKHWVEELRSRSGVKFHLHQFRHTFAVNLINNGCDLAKLKQLLGHNDVRMTVRYLRCLPTKMMKMDVDNLSLDGLLDYPGNN